MATSRPTHSAPRSWDRLAFERATAQPAVLGMAIDFALGNPTMKRRAAAISDECEAMAPASDAVRVLELEANGVAGS